MVVWVDLICETALVWAAGILVDSMKCCCFYSYSSLLHPFLGCTGVRILAGGSPHLLKMNCGHWSKGRGNKCMVKCKGCTTYTQNVW